MRLVNNLEPDIIVFTGDALNTSRALPVFKETMKGMRATIGKYAVKGNIDIRYWYNLDLFDGTGFKVLDQDSIAVAKNGETVTVAGLNYLYPERYIDLLKNLPEDKYTIFLHHYPGLIEDIEGAVDLYLAGHTHGGQVALPFYGALTTLSEHSKKYESGKYTVGETILYINRGIGMEGGSVPRVRFWARPEITVFNIIPKTSAKLRF